MSDDYCGEYVEPKEANIKNLALDDISDNVEELKQEIKRLRAEKDRWKFFSITLGIISFILTALRLLAII